MKKITFKITYLFLIALNCIVTCQAFANTPSLDELLNFNSTLQNDYTEDAASIKTLLKTTYPQLVQKLKNTTDAYEKTIIDKEIISLYEYDFLLIASNLQVHFIDIISLLKVPKSTQFQRLEKRLEEFEELSNRLLLVLKSPEGTVLSISKTHYPKHAQEFLKLYKDFRDYFQDYIRSHPDFENLLSHN